ncbi:MAG TPA: hypothetical protein VIJ00_05075, partial [Nakamurella sp.]
DAALAIAALLEAGVRRVGYVDVDAHHGDGVQAAFYDDPRVLTVSIHVLPVAESADVGVVAGADGGGIGMAPPGGAGGAMVGVVVSVVAG